MKEMMHKCITIGRPIEKEMPSIEAEMLDTHGLEYNENDDGEPFGSQDEITTLMMIEQKKQHSLSEKLKNFKYLS